MNIFELFDNGKCTLADKTVYFSEIQWSEHSNFKGVELKHIVTSKDTDGMFSYHLVKIAPNCAIDEHIHNCQLETHEVIKGSGICIMSDKKLKYDIGTVSIIPANIKHKVIADKDGLYLFAKFMPALC